MLEKILCEPRPPWLIRVGCDEKALDSFVESFRDKNPSARVAILDGEKMRMLATFYRQLAATMEFPDYVGANFNALSEALTDLDWLEFSKLVLVIENFESVLADEKQDVRLAALELFRNVAKEWSHPISVGEAWDRGPIPFHVVCHDSKFDKSAIPSIPLIELE